MSDIQESYFIEDPGDLEAALKDLFKGGSVEETWAEADLGGPRPVDDDVAAAPDEEAIKNAEVVIEFEAPDTRSGTRTRKLSTMSLSGDKKRRKTKLDDFGGDTKAHLRHRKMNNESVKRCREKKKQEYEALRTGYKKQEEELRTAKKEMEKLKAVVKKLQAATHAPATTNDNANENLVAEVISLKAILQDKNFEIASLKLERNCGFAEVARLEEALRPFKHQELEQTWGVVEGDSEQGTEKGLPDNNEILFNQVINE